MTSFFSSLFSSRENPGVKLIVFDFDGTLADTRSLLIKIVKKHLAKFNISLTEHLLNVFGNAPLQDYISLAGIRNDFVKSVGQSIEEDFIVEYRNIKSCKNFYTIKDIPTKKIIVSNNNTEFVEKTLHFWRANFFDKVLGANHFKNKVYAILSLGKKYSISPDEIIYVGDKDIDVDVARNVGCISVIVSNKFSWSSRKDILKKKPDYLIKDLGTLSEIVNLISSTQITRI